GELAPYRHDEARAEQRDVERLPVVRSARPIRLELALQVFNELAFGADVAQEVLSQDELAVCDVRKSDQEHVRARATGEPRGLCVEEKDVRPVAGCVALEAKVREEERIARSPSDDLEPEIVHARERRWATDSRTSAPRAYAGPTQDGHPVWHPQDARCSRARSKSTGALLKRRSAKPMPPGVMSKR